ncbi:MAG: PAQR family membrane homeostasis protein TrhA [Gemmataceae bacterium]
MSWLLFRDAVSTWTHLLWMLLALPATVILWRRSQGDRPKQLSFLIFGVTLVICSGSSVLYHAVHRPHHIYWFETLDYIGIYLLIAGSCTPVAFNLLNGRWRWSILTLAWSMALVGICLRLTIGEVHPVIYTGYYMWMGWVLVSCYLELARAVTHRAMSLILVGGLFYSVGATLNLAGWPVLWPGVFGPHEIFHLFVMAGSFTHFWFMFKYIVPFPRQRADDGLEPDPPARLGAEEMPDTLVSGSIQG